MFLGQVKSLIICILVAAGGASAVLGEVVEAVAILTVVVFDAAIDFYQDSTLRSRSRRSRMTAPQAKVRRDGSIVSIPASQIVAGDVLAWKLGIWSPLKRGFWKRPRLGALRPR